ncbi:MAG: hypothetical protein NVSMB49_11130 [Ktedonobacteraceae bacterium]
MHANNDNSHTTLFDDEEITFMELEPDEEYNRLHTVVQFGNCLFKGFGVKMVTHPALEEDDDECEFDIRMTDVPEDVLVANTEPDLVEVRLATLGKDIWQRTPHRRMLVSLLLILLLALLVSMSFGQALLQLLPLSSVLPQASQARYFNRGNSAGDRMESNLVSSGPDNAVVVMARTIPHDCPTGTILGQRRQVGNFPVWLAGIDTTATIHLPTLVLKTMKGWKGWVVPLRLAAKYNYMVKFNLTIFNFYGSSAPLFQNPYTSLTAPRLFLDTKHPMSFVGTSGIRRIGTWNILLYLPSAGCYAISASWGQGHWIINFSAGQ